MQFVVLHCCDIIEGKNNSSVQHETTVERLCILCLFSRVRFWSINCVMNPNMAGTLSAREEYAMILSRNGEIKVAFLAV